MKKLLMLLTFCGTTLFARSQNITAAEYFIDADPGQGNGISITVPAPADTISFTANIPATLPAGFHTLAIRTRDANGSWSHFEKRGFYVDPTVTDLPNIVAAEYFIDTDPGIGNGTAIPIGSPDSIYSETLFLSIGSLPLGNYRLAIRVKNLDGQWSLLENMPFNVCNTYGGQAEFEYQVEGNRIFFTNNSLYYDTITWKFGDTTIDTVVHPVKTYAAAGIYNVQLIAGNACGTDTLARPVEIRGLQRLNPASAGNGGISTIMFEGFGFTAGTQVKLVSGAQLFLPVMTTFLSSNRISAKFDLTGLVPGVYRAIATLGSGFDTLDNALHIEQSTPADITLDITNGRYVTRPSRIKFTGIVKNNGNQDAIMVPYFITMNILPGVTSINMNAIPTTLMANIQNQGLFQHTYQYLTDHGIPAEVMSASCKDTARNRHLISYYRTRIPGRSSSQEIASNAHGLLPHAYQLGAVVGEPLLDSYALLDSINTEYQACYSAFLKREVEKQLNITISNAGWNNCFTPAFDSLMRTLARISQDASNEYYGVPMQAALSALLAKVSDCAGSGIPPGLSGITFKRIIQGTMNNWIYLEDVDSLDPDCIDTSIQVFSRPIQPETTNTVVPGGKTAAGGCNECPGAQVFPELCDQCLPLILAGKVGKKLKMHKRAFGANSAIKGCQEWCESTSIDPNAKYGPGDNDGRIHINHYKDVSFRITFENLSTATAPAAYVEITDTIDKNVFDISSLQLGAFSWGDSLINLEPNEQNVSLMKSLKPAHPNFLRVDAVTDTSAGIVRWRFWTVDTVTLQLTSDPTQGFLPPNTDGISGAGYVTYSIKPKPTVPNGTALQNQATIVFDDNSPILTNVWEYRIDTVSPGSSVNALPFITPSSNFSVSWSGSDTYAGVDLYSVYVSVNDSAYQLWQHLTALTSATFTGQFGKTYKFFSVALDKAGNYEEPPFDPLQNPDAVTTVQAPLPLNLLSFEARKTMDGRKVELRWNTVNETDVSHFEIQRGADPGQFSRIGSLAAQNNVAGSSYHWVDSFPHKNNYYRLIMVDQDSSFTLSPVRIVRFDGSRKINVFPTLTPDFVYVQSDERVYAELFDLHGKLVQAQPVNGTATFNLEAQSPGVYFIRIKSLNETFKVVKY